MEKKMGLALTKTNIKLMAIGFGILIFGFQLMIGGGSEDGVTFNPEIYNTQRTVIAPMVCLIGFVFEIFAIIYLPKEKREEADLMN